MDRVVRSRKARFVDEGDRRRGVLRSRGDAGMVRGHSVSSSHVDARCRVGERALAFPIFAVPILAWSCIVVTVAGAASSSVGTQWVYPLSVMDVQLSGSPPGNSSVIGFENPDFARRLASIALEGYNRYKDEILPEELKKDKRYAREFAAGDPGRVNRAFFRWQKMVFQKQKKISFKELAWDGQPVPALNGISYDWSDLYESQEFKSLRRYFVKFGRAFIKAVTRDQQRVALEYPFVWVDVLRPGEFMRTHTHTGAPLGGHFVARIAPGNVSSQKLIFEDPRGVTPPFGRQHEHSPVEGELMLWPSWAPHMLTPNRGQDPIIYMSVTVFPKRGVEDFDWEDDVLSDVIKTEVSTLMPRKNPKDEL